jgi:hypothetical protein
MNLLIYAHENQALQALIPKTNTFRMLPCDFFAGYGQVFGADPGGGSNETCKDGFHRSIPDVSIKPSPFVIPG